MSEDDKMTVAGICICFGLGCAAGSLLVSNPMAAMGLCWAIVGTIIAVRRFALCAHS